MPTVATASDAGDNFDGDITNPGTNVANYSFGADWDGQDGHVTTVGSAGQLSESFYGTSDQGGNVYEWTETLVTGSLRVVRGGSWGNQEITLRSSDRILFPPPAADGVAGFRVASPVPVIPTVSEWGIIVMTLLTLTGGTVVFARRRAPAT